MTGILIDLACYSGPVPLCPEDGIEQYKGIPSPYRLWESGIVVDGSHLNLQSTVKMLLAIAVGAVTTCGFSTFINKYLHARAGA